MHAALAGGWIGYYSRRGRQGSSGGRFPAGRSRTPDEGRPAAAGSRPRRDTCNSREGGRRPTGLTLTSDRSRMGDIVDKRDRRTVAQEVTHLLSQPLDASKPLSILDLQCLRKEQWQDIDAAAHVRRERASWD